MAKIIFLRPASRIPTKDRDNASFLFSHKKETWLVDCPGAICHKLLKAGFDFKKLQNVIITHEHPDHIYGIVSLIHSQAFLNDKLNIFASAACLKIIKKLVAIFTMNKPHYPKMHYRAVSGAKPFYRQAGLTIKAVKNRHIPGSFGLRFGFNKKTLVYTSDTVFRPKLLKPLPHYLIHDCTASSHYFQKHPVLYKMHTAARQLAQYLKDKPQAKLIPIHFLLLAPGEEKRIRQELKPLGKRCLFVKDFQTLRL